MSEKGSELSTRFTLGDVTVDGDTLSVHTSAGHASLEPRAFRVLRYFAENPGKLITIDELMTEHWDGTVVAPNAVTRVIAQLRKALGDDARNPQYIETVARTGYRLVAPVDRDVSPNRKTSVRRPVLLAAAVLFLIVAGAVLWPAPPNEPSIAVYPFANMTGDEALDYVGDGVAEEVISALSGEPAFLVTARSVSFQYPASGKVALDFARQLEAAYFVDGSVRREGELLRLSTQLIESRSGRQVWAESGDFESSALFAAQELLSRKLVAAFAEETGIEVVNLATTAIRTPNPEAYELYLRGRRIWHRRGVEPLEPAVGFFAEAVRIDPEFARGWAALASAYITWPSYSPKGESTRADAEAIAEKALQLDPTLAEPHGVLAVFAESRGQWRRAHELLNEAVRRNQRSSTVHFWLSDHLLKTGYVNESFRHLRIARELDPAYVAPKLDTAWAHLLFGDASEAERQYAVAWRGGIESMEVWVGRYFALLAMSELAEAERWLDSSPFEAADLAMQRRFVAALLSPDSDPALVGDLLAMSELDHRFAMQMAAMLGEYDKAGQFIRQRLEQDLWVDGLLLWGPGTDLRLQPGYGELMQLRGLVEYWEEFGWGDVCRPDRDTLICDAQGVDLTLLPPPAF